MRRNVSITTSGFFDQVALKCAIAKLGIDNVMFSVDDPFGDNFEGVAFLNDAELSIGCAFQDAIPQIIWSAIKRPRSMQKKR